VKCLAVTFDSALIVTDRQTDKQTEISLQHIDLLQFAYTQSSAVKKLQYNNIATILW